MEGTLTSGKKWASGTGAISSSVNSKFNYVLSGSLPSTSYYFDIKLTFTPSIIVVCAYDNNYEFFSVYNKLGKTWKPDNVKSSTYTGTTSRTYTHNLSADGNVAIGNNTYRIPVDTNSLPLVWVAYE